jgi:Adaptive response protein AidB N-terminal domain
LQIIPEVFDDLEQFGHRIVTTIDILGKECEQNPPRLEQFDAWGKRVDKLITTPAWKEMKCISAEEGLIAIAYERKYGELRFSV